MMARLQFNDIWSLFIGPSGFPYLLSQTTPSVSIAFCVHNTVWSAKYYLKHYNDVIIVAMASQITSLTIVYSTVYSSAD